jgi:C4-dicarboxylate-specific signal transduction histidine kinase
MWLIERVQKLTRAPAIVMVADAANDEQRAQYIAAGADHYLSDGELVPAMSALAHGQFGGGAISPEESQRLLGRMTAGVIHDVNNYLNVIEVTMRLLRRDPSDIERVHQPMRQALDAVARLTANLLSYARGAAPAACSLDLGAIVRDMLALIARVVPPSIAVTMRVVEPTRTIQGVRPELEQLVLNLLLNAIDAMPTGGELEVVVRYRDAAAVLEVADTGRGLFAPATDQMPLSTKHAGRGLGLGIARAVVEHHRGALRIGRRDTGGTAVTVMLPLGSE